MSETGTFLFVGILTPVVLDLKQSFFVAKKIRNVFQVHIPPEKLFECGECVWVGDRLDNIRYFHLIKKINLIELKYVQI